MGVNSTGELSKWRILAAAASAGLVVDSVLFPLDTIKTRLQSDSGFKKTGGFSKLYRGILPVLTGSIPNGMYLLLCNKIVFNLLLIITR